jgi:hypothetical protein
MLGGLDIPLLAYFFFWYLGNYYYNISNKTALKAAGGALGYPMTISTLQLGVGSLYALFLWAAPDARSFPSITAKDIVKLLPVAFCAAGAHAGSVFALSAGAVSFGQIVKAAEPAFAAVVGTKLYGAISASRGAAVPSRRRRDSYPSDEVVGGFFFDFEAVHDAPRRQEDLEGQVAVINTGDWWRLLGLAQGARLRRLRVNCRVHGQRLRRV